MVLTNRFENMAFCCCSLDRSWKLHLEVIGEAGKIERHPYYVQLKSEGGCCTCRTGTHELSVNDVVKEKELYDNICSPILGKGGVYEWEEKGHFFRVELPSLYIKENLYVNGYEVKSKNANTSVWMMQFLLFLVIGTLFIVAGIILTIIDPEKLKWSSSRFFGISLIVIGIIILLPGIIGSAKAQNLSVKTRKELKRRKEQDTFREDVTKL